MVKKNKIHRLHIGKSEPDHDRLLNTSCDDQKIPSWSAFNSFVTTEHIEEQSVGFLHVISHPVTDNATEYTAVDNFLDILTQLDLTSLIVTSYGTRNQTGTTLQIQGVGNLNRHIYEHCLELFGQIPEGQWSS